MCREINKITIVFEEKIKNGSALIIHIHTPTKTKPLGGIPIELMNLLKLNLLGSSSSIPKYQIIIYQ